MSTLREMLDAYGDRVHFHNILPRELEVFMGQEVSPPPGFEGGFTYGYVEAHDSKSRFNTIMLADVDLMPCERPYLVVHVGSLADGTSRFSTWERTMTIRELIEMHEGHVEVVPGYISPTGEYMTEFGDHEVDFHPIVYGRRDRCRRYLKGCYLSHGGKQLLVVDKGVGNISLLLRAETLINENIIE